MQTVAVVMDGPGQAALRSVTLTEPGAEDVVVDIQWTSISAGTERLLWSGRMPPFPGMGYPLVPGYESVGRVIDAGAKSGLRGGEFVFVPGARCFTEVRGLFGGAAARLVVPGARVSPIDADLGERGALLSLAATAYHALADANPPDLIVGNGVLGRLLSRVTVALGHPSPTVWENQACRRAGASVITEEDDDRHDYRTIYDASGDETILDHAGKAAGARRRDRARGLLPRAAEFHLPAGLHAGDALPHRGRIPPRRPGGRAGADRIGRVVARRIDHASPSGR